MYGEISLFEGFEVFFELYCSIVFIICKKRLKRLPKLVSCSRFGKHHSGEIGGDGIVYP